MTRFTILEKKLGAKLRNQVESSLADLFFLQFSGTIPEKEIEN